MSQFKLVSLHVDILYIQRLALIHISFRPQHEIKAKLWDGQTNLSGPSFVRLQYMCIYSSMHCQIK